MYVKVQYYKGNGIYGGAAYSYETKLALEPMDKVIAPTATEPRQRAIVTICGVDKPAFACKEITEYDLESEVESV